VVLEQEILKKNEEIENIFRKYSDLKNENKMKQQEILENIEEIEKIYDDCSDLKKENSNLKLAIGHLKLEINELEKKHEIICLNKSTLYNSTRNSSNYMNKGLLTLKQNQIFALKKT